MYPTDKNASGCWYTASTSPKRLSNNITKGTNTPQNNQPPTDLAIHPPFIQRNDNQQPDQDDQQSDDTDNKDFRDGNLIRPRSNSHVRVRVYGHV